jgi:putative pyruvate formate lyase activating enzyme
MSQPSYLELSRSGELSRRADGLRQRLASCDLCPRRCGGDRTAGEVGVCGVGDRAVLASASPHFGEESPLVGRHGSGTIFFSGCNLRCEFCQNADISMSTDGPRVDAAQLAGVMLRLQDLGCHNINLVTPTHVVPQILDGLVVAVEEGLTLPIVYNTGGYDDLEVVQTLDGVVDIYMPDCKFADPEVARRFCDAPDYPEVNRSVLKEMHRQVGDLEVAEDGIAVRGMLVRHLVMPEGLAGTAETMAFLASELSTSTYVNLMDQYRPCHHAGRYPELGRGVTQQEMEEARSAALAAGITRLDDRIRRFVLRWL